MAAASEVVAFCMSVWVARLPLVSPAPVRVRVAALHTSVASVPNAVSVREEYAQTFAGTEVNPLAMPDARDVDAVSTVAFVLAFMTAARDDEAVPIVVFTLVVALLISTLVASAPELSAALVSERVPYAHMSAGVSEPPPIVERTVSILVASTFPIEPTVVMVVVATFQTAAGSALMDEPSEVEAVSTALFVFVFITAAKEEVATATLLSVLLFTTAAIELEAMPTRVSVLLFIAVWLAVIADPSELEAVVTSDWSASEPLESEAPVRVRVPFVQTSAASVPKPVRVRVPAAHTLAGMEVIEEAIEERVEPSEVEAVSTVAFVFAFTTAASELVAIPTRVSVFALIAVWLFEMAEPRDEVAV